MRMLRIRVCIYSVYTSDMGQKLHRVLLFSATVHDAWCNYPKPASAHVFHFNYPLCLLTLSLCTFNTATAIECSPSPSLSSSSASASYKEWIVLSGDCAVRGNRQQLYSLQQKKYYERDETGDNIGTV